MKRWEIIADNLQQSWLEFGSVLSCSAAHPKLAGTAFMFAQSDFVNALWLVLPWSQLRNKKRNHRIIDATRVKVL